MKKFRRGKANGRGGGRMVTQPTSISTLRIQGVTQPTSISTLRIQQQHTSKQQQQQSVQQKQQIGAQQHHISKQKQRQSVQQKQRQSVQQKQQIGVQQQQPIEQQQHVQEQLLVEEEPDQEPSGKIELMPNELWFWNTKVSRGVSQSFKAHYNEAYNSFEEVPTAVKERWFNEFKRTYTWRPEFEIMARKDYFQKCAKHFSDSLNKVAKLDPSVEVEWMDKNVRAAFIKKRRDPIFVARSEKARVNHCASQIGNTKFDRGHRQGRVTTRQAAENMASENDGILPIAADVYESIHSVVAGADEDLDLAGDKRRKIMMPTGNVRGGRGGVRGGGDAEVLLDGDDDPTHGLDDDNDETEDMATEITLDMSIPDGDNSILQGDDSSSESKQLDPDTLWFDDNKVTRAITNSIQQFFNEPWRNWSEVNNETKDQWFNTFKRSFTWKPELHETVRKAFNKKAGLRLKDLHNLVTIKLKGVKPSWMSADVHKRMMERRINDPAFQKRSEIAKKNKRGGSLENAIEPGHFQGSISAAEHARRLAKQNGGVLPKAGDLYMKFHSRETEPGKGKELIGSKPKQIMGEYEKKMAEYKEKGIEKDPNEVYFEVVGGRKRGRIPGLGTAGDLLYKKSSTRSSCSDNSSSFGYTPSILSQLSMRMEQQTLELETQRLALEKQRAAMEAQRLQIEQERLEREKEKVEESKRMNEYLAEMRKTMQEYTQAISSNCGGSFPEPQLRDPRDPSSGGSHVC